MAAPSLLFPPSAAPSITRDFAAEASLERVRAAATVARDRIAELDGVRVLGPEVKSDSDSVALRSTCATRPRRLAGRLRDGRPRLHARRRVAPRDRRPPDRGRHQGRDPAPARAGAAARALVYASELERSPRALGGASDAPPRSARGPRPSGRRRSRAGPPGTWRARRAVALQPADRARQRALAEVHGAGARSCMRGARRSRKRVARAPRTRSSRARARPAPRRARTLVRAWRASRSRHSSARSVAARREYS